MTIHEQQPTRLRLLRLRAEADTAIQRCDAALRDLAHPPDGASCGTCGAYAPGGMVWEYVGCKCAIGFRSMGPDDLCKFYRRRSDGTPVDTTELKGMTKLP